MQITKKDIKSIKSELLKRKPSKFLVDKNLSLKEIILHLASTLIKMKNKGFTTEELLNFLSEYKINIKGATLNRYLNEYLKEKNKFKKSNDNERLNKKDNKKDDIF